MGRAYFRSDLLADRGAISDVSVQNAYLLWRNGGRATWIEG
jgi:hypothetical protein